MGLFELRMELSPDLRQLGVQANGDVRDAVTALARIGGYFKLMPNRKGLLAPVSWPLMVQIAGVTKGYRSVLGPRLREWITDQTERRISAKPLTCSVNTGAPAPRDYQIAGAEMVASMKRALVLDEMGVGKTLTALLGLTELLERRELTGPTLVVAPNSVMDDWVSSAWRWTPFHARAYRGPAAKRRKLLSGPGARDMIVCGYGVIANDFTHMIKELRPSALVVDELHWTKDPDTNRSRAVRALSEHADVFIALSGTPITHRTKGLWPSLYCVDGYGWPNPERFKRFLNEDGDLAHSMEPLFRAALRGQTRRVAKADVLAQLPPKIHTVRHVELPPAARKVYTEIEQGLAAEVDGGTIAPMGMLAALLRLNQLAAATGAVVPGDNGPMVKLRAPSWKVDALMEVLEERDGQQTVVFAPSRQLIDLATARARKEGYRVGLIVGGQKPDERTLEIAAFQAGEYDVIMATTSAGGIGVTLTAASAVVFLQRPWSYVEAQQAEDRAHRIGSERHESIDIIDIVAVDTVDQYVRDTLKNKAESLAKLLEDPRIQHQCLGGQS